jgi:DmsE family decaheme c-type cytochrome
MIRLRVLTILWLAWCAASLAGAADELDSDVPDTGTAAGNTAAENTVADSNIESVGSEFCVECHDDVAAAFKTSVHWKKDPERACESCHGPGGAHVEEYDPEKIRRFTGQVPAHERSAVCLECHGRERTHSGFKRSDHALASVACNDCHNPHEAEAPPQLARSTPGLCYGCHATVRSAFSLNERHPVNEGGVDCIDCHDPHRRSSRSILGGFKQAACLKCHGEYRGPWFFEHEAVTVEGCITCHTPHGSVNRHLLTYQRVGDLCLSCHPEQPFFHDVVDPSGQRTTGFNDCTRCHTEIHGSNNDALFLN